MKTFVCVLALAAVAVAEPPRYQYARYRFQRQELEDGNEAEATTPRADDAPYPAAGFRPDKEFNLPTRQGNPPPAVIDSTPDNSYGAPLNTYGAPQSEIPEHKEEDKEQDENQKNEQTEPSKQNLEEQPQADAEVVSSQGAYYVLLPNYQLQRVVFQTQNDLQNMAYTARLQYRNEDRAPLFVYTAAPQYQSAAYVQFI